MSSIIGIAVIAGIITFALVWVLGYVSFGMIIAIITFALVWALAYLPWGQ